VACIEFREPGRTNSLEASSTFLDLPSIPIPSSFTNHPYQIIMDGMNAVYAQDEYGRPFIILREQQKKSRLSGIEAQKVTKNVTRKRERKKVQ